ncbi:hypothetical protein RR42_s2720 [Cupriavidus basilensis]|uniref:Uncharacterized protein n=1 Tax=Cupriavidus basilensis TaxID=68895 RepID=A0A0C4YUN1_9BURK|nr:hypothetical protein RR42_s2720 [Cupriavidus basilensis]
MTPERVAAGGAYRMRRLPPGPDHRLPGMSGQGMVTRVSAVCSLAQT